MLPIVKWDDAQSEEFTAVPPVALLSLQDSTQKAPPSEGGGKGPQQCLYPILMWKGQSDMHIPYQKQNQIKPYWYPVSHCVPRCAGQLVMTGSTLSAGPSA
jgi:hypothetical protein